MPISGKRGPGLLKIDHLFTGYGSRRVLADVSLEVGRGEVVALIGHNGAGKSTLFKAIFGLLSVWSGTITFDGDLLVPSPRSLLRRAVAYTPQGHRVFGGLSVRDNLEIVSWARCHDGSGSIERALSFFPPLRSRLSSLARDLSGGERQMLALGLSILSYPHLLLLDEPSLGLAPALARKVLMHIRQMSLDDGIGVLVAEQRVREILNIASKACILRGGEVSYFGPVKELDAARLRKLYL